MKCKNCLAVIAKDTQGSWIDVTQGDGCIQSDSTNQTHEPGNEFDGNACPNCLDVMDNNVTCLRPIWSDYYDDVVCLTCAEEYANV
jgi:hypothetical protein